jgi:hypothetical protein
MMPLNYEEIIRWGLMNFSLAMLILSVPLIVIHFIANLFLRSNSNFEIIFRWVSLFAVGFAGIYAFVMHVFFPVTASQAIGWHVSPFQFEVGMANLAFGILGILAFRNSFEFRLAMVIGVTFWLWGDAVGHIYQMVTQNNMSVGNAGSWFWMDVALPLILIICIYRMSRLES